MFGTYHVTNTGQCTWYEFAREILLQAGITTELRETTSERFPTLARRPKFSALRHGAMDALGFPADADLERRHPRLLARASNPGRRPGLAVERLDKVRCLLDKQMRGLEIGPSFNPTAPKSEGWKVETIDHAHARTIGREVSAARRRRLEDRRRRLGLEG